MQIKFVSVMVHDQNAALEFYTAILGFTKMADIPMGEYRWLTVTSPEGVAGVELLLEPDAHPAAREFQRALHRDGIPATSFESPDIQAEYARLRARGVVFRTPPTPAGPVTVAVFDDTCGNLIQLHQALEFRLEVRHRAVFTHRRGPTTGKRIRCEDGDVRGEIVSREALERGARYGGRTTARERQGPGGGQRRHHAAHWVFPFHNIHGDTRAERSGIGVPSFLWKIRG